MPDEMDLLRRFMEDSTTQPPDLARSRGRLEKEIANQVAEHSTRGESRKRQPVRRRVSWWQPPFLRNRHSGDQT